VCESKHYSPTVACNNKYSNNFIYTFKSKVDCQKYLQYSIKYIYNT